MTASTLEYGEGHFQQDTLQAVNCWRLFALEASITFEGKVSFKSTIREPYSEALASHY
jgi:hypothetical protein